jgi:hypothetical protein
MMRPGLWFANFMITIFPVIATAETMQLAGTWYSGGNTYEIYQNGSQVKAVFTAVGKEAKTLGFASGDVSFIGTVSDEKHLAVKMYFHFPVEFKSACPDKFTDVQPIRLLYAVLPEKDKVITYVLSGEYVHKTIYPDCTEKVTGRRHFELRQDLAIITGVTAYGKAIEEVASNETPTRVVLELEVRSAPVGQAIKLNIALAGLRHSKVIADRSYNIGLRSSTGTVTPKSVTIEKGMASATASLESRTPGDAIVTASPNNGAKPTQGTATFCDTGSTEIFIVTPPKGRGPADGTTPITVAVKFADKNGTAVKLEHPRVVSLSSDGVGKWIAKPPTSSSFTVPANECVGEADLTSEDPGTMGLTVSVPGLPDVPKSEFTFFPLLGWSFLALAAIGGICGAFVRLYQVRLSRRSLISQLSQIGIGVISGLVVSLACYYGLAGLAGSASNASGMGFLLGVIGGYLGTAALDIVAGIVLPTRPQKKGNESVGKAPRNSESAGPNEPGQTYPISQSSSDERAPTGDGSDRPSP